MQFRAQQRPVKRGDPAVIPDIDEVTWTQMHSHARAWWEKLTDAQLQNTKGKVVALFGLLQAEYGYSRERAEAELKRRLKEYATSQQEHPLPETLFT
jgi:hypothetical protein